MNEMTINFNGEDYIARYNEQTGYYEINLTAPLDGGIYKANIKFTDIFEDEYEAEKAIQVLAKEEIKVETNKVFMWIFSHNDFSVKDIVELSDYEINIDEETNANTFLKVLKRTAAEAEDIIAIKKSNEVIYWGVIDNIQNEDGKNLYEYTVKYITNLFNQKVILDQNVDDNEIQDGYYRIKFIKDTSKVLNVANASLENGANVEIYEKNTLYSEIWKITKNSGYYKIINFNSRRALDVEGAVFEADRNVQQLTNWDTDAQKWLIEKVEGNSYRIKTATANYYLTVTLGGTDNGTNIKIATLQSVEPEKQIFLLEKVNEIDIKEVGIEDYIAKTIEENFISNKDTLVNKEYLQVEVKTHTPKQTSVTNVENNIYNLHTWMTNCTQNYDIVYNFSIVNNKLLMTIESKEMRKQLIDTKAQAISNYAEVFETNIVSKVVVLTSTNTYTLYLLNDRTTTTDMTNPNRAVGKTEVVYTEKYEDAAQTALDIIKANSYNHNITFDLYNEFIPIGTPIAIKTRESLIFDTYISAITITQKKFIKYTCGNIRTNLIDKLLKERSN